MSAKDGEFIPCQECKGPKQVDPHGEEFVVEDPLYLSGGVCAECRFFNAIPNIKDYQRREKYAKQAGVERSNATRCPRTGNPLLDQKRRPLRDSLAPKPNPR